MIRNAADPLVTALGGLVTPAPASLSGAITVVRCVARGKYSSIVRPLIHVVPSPGRRMTRATDVLRFPVPRY